MRPLTADRRTRRDDGASSQGKENRLGERAATARKRREGRSKTREEGRSLLFPFSPSNSHPSTELVQADFVLFVRSVDRSIDLSTR